MSSNHDERKLRQKPENQIDDTGSPAQGEPVFLAVGRLRKPHGLAGELSMDILTDFPERLKTGKKVFLGEKHQAATITGSRPHGQLLLVKFDVTPDIESAEGYRNTEVFVEAASLPSLDEGDLYQHQVIGMQAVLESTGELVGMVVDILETGANDVYIIQTADDQELLIPAVEAFIAGYNLAENNLLIRLSDEDKANLLHDG